MKKKFTWWLFVLAVGARLPLFAGVDYAEEILRTLKHQAPWDLREATYVRVEHIAARRSWIDPFIPGVHLHGNAWLLEETPDGKSAFVINGCEQVRFTKPNELEAAQLDNQRKGIYKSPEAAFWEKADLKKELAGLLEDLEDGNSQTMRRIKFNTLRHNGYLLWYAVNAAKAGHQEEALFLTRLLLDHTNAKALMKEALSQLADARYAELSREWLDSGDDDAFVAGLEALLERFGEAWTRREPVERQVHNMRDEERKALWSEIKREFYDDLLENPQHQRHYDLYLWLLPREPPENPEAASPLNALLRQRREALPFLLSLLEDYTPLPIEIREFLGLRQTLGGPWLKVYRYIDPILMTVHHRDPINLSTRAVTVAEVAQTLISSTLWWHEDERTAYSGIMSKKGNPLDTFAEAAGDWMAQRAPMTDLELCRDFLNNRHGHPNAVLHYLVEHGSDLDIQTIETRLIGDGRSSLSGIVGKLLPYVKVRGPKAADFLDRYASTRLQSLKAEAERREENAPDDQRERVRERYEADKAKLAYSMWFLRGVMNKEELLPEIIETLATGEIPWNDAWPIYKRALAEKPESGLSLALAAAQKTEDPELKFSYLIPAVDAALKAGLGGEPTEPDKSAWHDLLRDAFDRWGVSKETSGLANELLILAEPGMHRWDPEDKWNTVFTEWERVTQLLGDKAHARYIQRAFDLLEGIEPNRRARVPHPDHVSPERRRELAGNWMRSNAWDELYEELTAEELLALPELLDTYKDLNQRLTSYANRISQIQFTEDVGEAIRPKLLAMEGTVVDPELLRSLLRWSGEELREGRRVQGSLRRLPLLRGFALNFESHPVEGEEAAALNPQNGVLRVSVQSNWQKLARGQKVVMTPDDSETNPRLVDEASMDKVWRLLSLLLGGEDNLTTPFEIYWDGAP